MENIADIHTHALHEIDDGSENLENSIAMLRIMSSANVRYVVLTPHFDIRKQDTEDFVRIRDENAMVLKKEVEANKIDIVIKTASELFYSQKLAETDLSDLVIEGTDYVLIELSTSEEPINLTYTLNSIIANGFIPIIAHIERYPYFRTNPELIYMLLDLGCLLQVNASTIIEAKEDRGFINSLIKKNYIHLIASDCHSINRRKPNIGEGLKTISKIYSVNTALNMNKNALDVFNNQLVETRVKGKIVKILGRFF